MVMLSDKEMSALSKLPKESLIDFIKDIYGVDKLLDKKIDRLILRADSPKLIKKLKTTLKGLNRRRKFVDYWESREFAAELEYLKSDVMSLYPNHPYACLELIELFMSTTNKSLERCDDSDGYVGDVYRSLADDWLTVATVCYDMEKEKTDNEQQVFSRNWIKKVKQMVSDNEYGTKDSIYLGITQLLSQEEIRALIQDYENEYDELTTKITLKEKQNTKLGEHKVTLYTNTDELGLEKFKLGYALEYLAQALGDVDLYERLFLKVNKKGRHNPRLLEQLITVFLKHNAYDKAKHYLETYWPEDNVEYQLQKSQWLAEIYQKQGELSLQLKELEKAFNLKPTPKLLNNILSLVSKKQRDIWLQKAKELAQQQKNVLRAVTLLLELNKLELANQMAVNRQADFAKYGYMALTDFLKGLPEEALVIKIIVYRSLLLDILNNSRKTAYGIAARYFKKLKQLDEQMHQHGLYYEGLQSHYEFVVGPLDKHSKKRSFWDKVGS